MEKEITDNDSYKKGYADAEIKFSKMILKIKTESYDKGYKDGANQKDNKPCLCGFWGQKK